MTTKKVMSESNAGSTAAPPPSPSVRIGTWIGIVGGIIAVVVAVGGAITYVVHMQGEIDKLKAPAALQEETQKDIGKINQATTDSITKLQATSIGFVEPKTPVICTVPAPDCEFDAYAGRQKQHDLDMQVPEGRKLLAAWYVPIDNVSDMIAFHFVDVTPSGRSTVHINLEARPGIAGRVRIMIYGVYGPQ
jgi:hypothetical protein